MKKNLGLVVVMCVAMLICANVASASVFINFEGSTPLPSGVTLNSNGFIDTTLGEASYPDHTLGVTAQGHFVRSTVGAPDKATLSFNFDVAAIDFWWSGLLGVTGAPGVTMNGAIYDVNGVQIDGGSSAGAANWEHVFAGPYSTPARSMSFWSIGGNNMAIDDITLYSANDPRPEGFNHGNVVPEPASLGLLGLGLLGLARKLRKK